MLSSIKKYLRVYQMFAATSFSQALSFRTSFVLLVFMDILFYFVSIASITIIYEHVQHVGPWSQAQFTFFIVFMMAVDNLHMGLVSESFWELSFKIRTGELDFVILKPIGTVFHCFFRSVRPSSIITSIIVAGLLIYYGAQLNFVWQQWLALPILIFLAFTLLIVLEFNICTLMFWMVNGMSINFLRMQLQGLSRWPNFVYASIYRKLFTLVLPFLLIGSAPVHFLYDFNQWQLMAGLILAILVSGVTLKFFWAAGIKHYDSASS